MARVFGKECRELFLLDWDYVHLTHGSLGTWPKIVHEAQNRILDELYKTTNAVFGSRHNELWFENLKDAALFLGSNNDNLVFVENSTTGFNTAIKNLKLKPGDAILISSWTYPSMKNACYSKASSSGCEVICLQLQLPIQDTSQIIQWYKDCIAEHQNIKVMVLDLISSPIAVLMPINELIKMCQDHKIISIVDGAHSPGQIPLDLESLGCDFYVGNFHKWMFTPRPCAVLWVHPQYQRTTKPLITSELYGDSDFRNHFAFQGTKNYSSYYACKDAINFFESVGGLSCLRDYASCLLRQAVQILCKKWNTKPMPIPVELEAPYMRMVQLPKLPCKYDCIPPGDKNSSFADMDRLTRDLRNNFKVVVNCLSINGEPYTRICASIYNTLDDYVRFADAVLELSNSQ